MCHVLFAMCYFPTRLPPPILVHITNGVVAVIRNNDKVKRRKHEAVNLAGIYGAALLATLVFRPQATLLAVVHVVFAGWFGYLYISKQVLGFLLYSAASGLILIGILLGGAYFGLLWFTGAILTFFGLLNTLNQARTKNIL